MFSPENQLRAKWEGRLAPMDEARLEFLVVTGDIAAYKTITGAIQKIGGAVNYTSTAATARAYIVRRKIDGVFLDMDMEGASDLIQDIRQGNSNRFAVLFGCADAEENAGRLLQTGIHFVLHKPLLIPGISQALKTAALMMEAERKRYVRHPLTVPVVIKLREKEQRAITSNLSKGGMAVRCQSLCEPGSSVQFTFELPAGEISGRGEVAWTNTDGFMGIKFYLLADKDKKSLSAWLDRRPAKPN